LKKNIVTATGLISIYLVVLILIMGLGYIDGKTLKSALIPIFVNLINFIAAITLFNVFGKEDNKSFLIYNFGGLVIRLLLMLAIIFYCLKFLNIEVYAFIFHFLIFYFLLQIIEIKIFAEYKQR